MDWTLILCQPFLVPLSATCPRGNRSSGRESSKATLPGPRQVPECLNSISGQFCIITLSSIPHPFPICDSADTETLTHPGINWVVPGDPGTPAQVTWASRLPRPWGENNVRLKTISAACVTAQRDTVAQPAKPVLSIRALIILPEPGCDRDWEPGVNSQTSF